MYVRMFIIATSICFNESSVSVMEDPRSLIFTVILSNPAAFDLTITVIPMYVEGTAIGENITVLTTYYVYVLVVFHYKDDIVVII